MAEQVMEYRLDMTTPCGARQALVFSILEAEKREGAGGASAAAGKPMRDSPVSALKRLAPRAASRGCGGRRPQAATVATTRITDCP